MSIQLFGVNVSRGVAIGRAVLIASSRIDVDHYYIAAEQADAEVKRLLTACDSVSGELEVLQRDLPSDAPHELGALLDVHRMLLHDEALIGVAAGWIRERHYNAEWALAAQLEVVNRTGAADMGASFGHRFAATREELRFASVYVRFYV
ncbi:MAG: phosphoenolpyruvate-utilizing N-terminal domain-containing protein, partial [Rubrivivax sp.]